MAWGEPMLLQDHSSPADLRNKAANDLLFFVRQVAEPRFIQKARANEPGKDQKKRRVATIEDLVNLPAPQAQVIFYCPHVGRYSRRSGFLLKLSHNFGQGPVKRCLIGAARGLLLGGRPFKTMRLLMK